MKLYERFGDRGFHPTVVTTFGVDFDAYESIALSRLRGSGCRNNILVADQRMLTHALSGASAPPQFAGRLYSVSGATAPGVFHPKVILQLGHRQGRLMIGSANATASGLAGNLELAGLIECTDEPSGEQSLIAESWSYLSGILDRREHTLFQQISWMEARAPWLANAEQAPGAVELSDGTSGAFLATDGEAGILDRFVAFVQGEAVRRLMVLSPYWDKDLAAVRELIARFNPKETVLLIDKELALFPKNAASGLPDTRILDIASLSNGRFVHAKLFVATTAEFDHVLYGSANCTIAAMGRRDFTGLNEEACIYRHLAAGSVTDALELDPLISGGADLQLDKLPDFSPDMDLPLHDLSERYPGVFECLFDTLIWHPPPTVNAQETEIELLKTDETQLACIQQRTASRNDGEVRFNISDADDRPAFARLRFPDGTASAPGIVSLVDVLRGETREVSGKGAERAATRLAEETEEGLWLLEVLDELEAAETATNEPISKTNQQAKPRGDEAEKFRKLDYAKFVAGCRLRSEGTAVGRNSLSGTEFSLVRTFLNRVLSLQDAAETSDNGDDEEEKFRKIVDTADDTPEAHAAMERGESFDDANPASAQRKKQVSRKRRIAAKRRANRDQIANAVADFTHRTHHRAKENELTSHDILRFRALITIVAAAGWDGPAYSKQREANDSHLTTLQVLPASGIDESWPRLLGKVLFALFGGSKPAILHLKVDDIFDKVPDDLIECWGCCFWAVQACRSAKVPELSRWFAPLAIRVYQLTALRADEMLDDRIIQVVHRMNDRFSARLGLKSDKILSAHRKAANGSLLSSRAVSRS